MPNLRRSAAALTARFLGLLLHGLEQGDLTWLARTLYSDRDAPQAVALADFARYYREIFHLNSSADMQANGEFALLRRLAGSSLRTVFDVGANSGEWTVALKQALPEAEVHAFEIMAPTADRFQARTLGLDGVKLNRFGLGNAAETISIWYNPSDDALTSMVEARTTEFAGLLSGWQRQEGRVVRGDDYLRSYGVRGIDLLKIDVEGAEMRVLSGLEATFAAGAIQVVQFEYGPLNKFIPLLLRDFYEFFEPRGFIVGKVFPKGVAFKPYEPDDENFVGLTYVACRADRNELVSRLRYST